LDWRSASPFPALEGCGASVGNEVIPLLLDSPYCYYKEFHKEVRLVYLLASCMEKQIHIMVWKGKFMRQPISIWDQHLWLNW
jgi:hypothetical protein